jgi:glycosyltransferase involved in cell wall biosynthesis
MNIRNADLLAFSVRQGDETSSHAVALARALTQEGIDTRIVCNYPPGPLAVDVRPLVFQPQMAGYRPERELTILEYPVWFPLAESFCLAPGVAIFAYHSLTPPVLWDAEEGRDQLHLAEINAMLVWHAHLAITASPFTAEELVRNTSYPQERIRVVPYGIDSAPYSHPPPPATLEALRREWRLQGQRVLLCTGGLAGNKRIDLVIDALAQLAGEGEDLHLFIIGDTESNPAARAVTAKLQAQASQLSLGERITFMGDVADLKPYLHLADVLILPGQHEGDGAPLLAGMAAGLPVVASASGAAPWVLQAESGKDQAAGLLFRPGEAGDLARQLRRVLTDASLRSALVERGRLRVQAFTPEKFAANIRQAVRDAGQLARDLPAMQRQFIPLYHLADVALRDYRVRSGLPLVGRLIEWVRTHSTTHVKEAYLDRMVESQVVYNRLLADEVRRLQAEVHKLQTQVASLRAVRERGEHS